MKEQDLGLMKFKPFMTLEEYSDDVKNGRDFYEESMYSNIVDDIESGKNVNEEKERRYYYF